MTVRLDAFEKTNLNFFHRDVNQQFSVFKKSFNNVDLGYLILYRNFFGTEKVESATCCDLFWNSITLFSKTALLPPMRESTFFYFSLVNQMANVLSSSFEMKSNMLNLPRERENVWFVWIIWIIKLYFFRNDSLNFYHQTVNRRKSTVTGFQIWNIAFYGFQRIFYCWWNQILHFCICVWLFVRLQLLHRQNYRLDFFHQDLRGQFSLSIIYSLNMLRHILLEKVFSNDELGPNRHVVAFSCLSFFL